MSKEELVDVVLRLQDLKIELYRSESQFKVALLQDEDVKVLEKMKQHVVELKRKIAIYSALINYRKHTIT